MPQPEGAALHHNYSPILTQMAQGMLMGLKDQFIARRLFPNLGVAVPSGRYTTWNRTDFMRRTAKKLANYEPVPLGGFGTGEGSYAVSRYGLGTMWTAMDLANHRAGGGNDATFLNAKMLYVLMGNLLELELQTASLVQTTNNWTNTRAGVANGATGTQFVGWEQVASDPVQDIDMSKKTFRDAIGFGPNTLVITEDIWYALRKNANLIDRIKYGGTMDKPTQITMQQLMALFEIDQIWIPTARYNTAKEGAAAVLAPVWGENKMWLGYVTSTPSVDQPSAGYHFSWTGNTSVGLPPGVDPSGPGPQNFDAVQNEDGIFIKRFRENRPSGEFLEGELFTTPNIVAADLGMTFTNVITR